MRGLIFVIFGLLSWSVNAQNLHYLRFSMGPKFEFSSIENAQDIELVNHLDAGAGIYLAKRFNEQVAAEIGLLKNDYSVRLQARTDDDLIAFENHFIPTYTSYQLGLMGNFQKQMNDKWIAYSVAGFQLFLTKRLSREGLVETSENLVDEDNFILRRYAMSSYSYGFESGNLIFRGDLGLVRKLSPVLALDIAVSGRAANLPIHSFKVNYDLDNMQVGENVVITNTGRAINVLLGIRYTINPLESTTAGK